jgi:two-component system, NarL family, response regulator LiaR
LSQQQSSKSSQGADRIRILVVDDHAIVRKGIIAMLETEPDFEVIGECSNGEEAIQKSQAVNPDVILMDLVMPRIDGVEAIRAIKQTQPGVNILVLTSFGTADKVFPSLNAGAIGYLLKDSDPNELVQAIRKVYQGEGWLHPAITRQVLTQFSQPAARAPEEDLTERELEVLRSIAQGLSNQEIAKKMVVSEATVHTHVSRVLNKLNLNSRTQAALYALRKGLAPLDPGE